MIAGIVEASAVDFRSRMAVSGRPNRKNRSEYLPVDNMQMASVIVAMNVFSMLGVCT